MREPQTIARTLRELPLFRELAPETAERLVRAGARRTFADGGILVREGEPSDSALVLLEGRVRVEVATAYDVVPLATLEAPALLGEVGVFAEIPRTATVRALGPASALAIPREAVLEAGRLHPELLRDVIAQLGRRLNGLNRAIGFYTDALAALEDEGRDTGILDDLLDPPAELLGFAATFRRLADQIRQRRAHLGEMASAAAIQRAMLPASTFVDPAGQVDYHAEFRPARDVGGDFHDVFALDGRRLAFTIGDVSGKGIPAALFMAVCQSVLRMTLREGGTLGGAVAKASDLLEADNTQSMFATVFVGVLDLDGGTLAFCNGGHNPPFLLRADGAAESLSMEPGDPPLATWSPAHYADRTVQLRPGDRILLYTDGLTEAHDAAMEEFGSERLLAIARGNAPTSSGELARAAIAGVDAFVGDAPQFDDMTCVAIRFRSGNTTP